MPVKPKRKPLLYFANGRWNCSVKLTPALVVGHGATPAAAWYDMGAAILNDASLLMAWVLRFPLSYLEAPHA